MKFMLEVKMMEKLILAFSVWLKIPLNSSMLAKFQLREVIAFC